ncbi:MAG: potassium channel family protein [Solirubrobacterales bacterium]
MSKKQFAVIGLGRFGSSVAKTLYELDNEVMGVDTDDEKVQNISEHITHAIQVDATDENSLKSLGIRNFDVAVIAIGADIQASIMATLIVKEMGVKYIIAKANSEIHAKVLYKIGADKVVLPERDMGTRVAHSLVSSNILDYIELSDDYNIAEIVTPSKWYGKTLSELNLRANYGLNIMAIKREDNIEVSPNSDYVIKENDIVVVIGDTKSLDKIQISTKK